MTCLGDAGRYVADRQHDQHDPGGALSCCPFPTIAPASFGRVRRSIASQVGIGVLAFVQTARSVITGAYVYCGLSGSGSSSPGWDEILSIFKKIEDRQLGGTDLRPHHTTRRWAVGPLQAAPFQLSHCDNHPDVLSGKAGVISSSGREVGKVGLDRLKTGRAVDGPRSTIVVGARILGLGSVHAAGQLGDRLQQISCNSTFQE